MTTNLPSIVDPQKVNSTVIPISFFAEIIRAVQTPLGFCALMTLVVGGFVAPPLFGVMAYRNVDPKVQMMFGAGLFAILVLLIVAVVAVELITSGPGRAAGRRPYDPGKCDTEETKTILEQHKDILHSQEGPPDPDVWDKDLRPVLQQSAYYTAPAYFLDTKLRMIDWNIAFDILFDATMSKLRGRHVNYFIIKLGNREAVFDHAREFTNKVRAGHLPLVDTEPLQFQSETYGSVSFLKVAVQLHDPAGKHRGWAVSLLPMAIDWQEFQRTLEQKIAMDKLWSVYSASYDRVLHGFAPYERLIADVIGVIRGAAGRKVADLGAGTGNVTGELVRRGHAVTAVESNQAMLDRLRAKKFNASQVTIVKASVEHLEMLSDESFDAAVLVNVLYAVDDPFCCLKSIHRILRPGGVIGFSTTHSDTNLEPLLASIKRHLKDTNRYEQLKDDYRALEEANRHIALTIARRWTRDEYKQWVVQAGFEIINDVPATYEDAVMLIHARKV